MKNFTDSLRSVEYRKAHVLYYYCIDFSCKASITARNQCSNNTTLSVNEKVHYKSISLYFNCENVHSLNIVQMSSIALTHTFPPQFCVISPLVVLIGSDGALNELRLCPKCHRRNYQRSSVLQISLSDKGPNNSDNGFICRSADWKLRRGGGLSIGAIIWTRWTLWRLRGARLSVSKGDRTQWSPSNEQQWQGRKEASKTEALTVSQSLEQD